MKINKDVFRYVSKETNRNLKLLAAKGRGDLKAGDKLTAIYVLSRDKDQEVSDTAKKTFISLNFDMLMHALDGKLDPLIIEKIVSMYPKNLKVLLKVVENPYTSDQVLQDLATTAQEPVIEALAENFVRIQQKPFLFDAMKKNPHTPKQVLDRLGEFMGIGEKEEEEKEEEKKADANEDVKEVDAAGEAAKDEDPEQKEQAPVSIFAAQVEASKDAGKDESSSLGDDETEGHDLSQEELDKEVEKAEVPDELKKEEEEEEEEEEEKPKNLTQLVKTLNVAGKIKLALEGNKEVREMLIKSTNKLVFLAVLKNPKITEEEILKLTVTKGTSEEILRHISRNREWMQNYQIKQTLITNPKTPAGIAIKLLNQIQDKDVEKIAKSRGIPSAVSSAAKKILASRKKK